MNQNRNPKGIPTGGQFASHERGEADVAIDQTEDDYSRWMASGNRSASTNWRSHLHGLDIIDRTVAQIAPTGSEIVFGRDADNEPFRLEAIATPDGTIHRMGIADEARTKLNWVDELDPELVEMSLRRDDDERFTHDYQYPRFYFPVGDAPIHPHERVQMHIDQVSDEAGLGAVMPPIFDVLIDRARGEEDEQERLAAYGKLDADQLTAMYERIIGPAIDDLATEISNEGDTL